MSALRASFVSCPAPRPACALPLAVGMYRGGPDETCNIVLDGVPAGQVAFVLYAGLQSVAIEGLIDGLRVGGRSVRGPARAAARRTV